MCDIIVDLPITLGNRPKICETNFLLDGLGIKSRLHASLMCYVTGISDLIRSKLGGYFIPPPMWDKLVQELSL